ncbi:hypothetical protein D3C87_1454920 [compost metagenome]
MAAPRRLQPIRRRRRHPHRQLPSSRPPAGSSRRQAPPTIRRSRMPMTGPSPAPSSPSGFWPTGPSAMTGRRRAPMASPSRRKGSRSMSRMSRRHLRARLRPIRLRVLRLVRRRHSRLLRPLPPRATACSSTRKCWARRFRPPFRAAFPGPCSRRTTMRVVRPQRCRARSRFQDVASARSSPSSATPILRFRQAI